MVPQVDSPDKENGHISSSESIGCEYFHYLRDYELNKNNCSSTTGLWEHSSTLLHNLERWLVDCYIGFSLHLYFTHFLNEFDECLLFLT